MKWSVAYKINFVGDLVIVAGAVLAFYFHNALSIYLIAAFVLIAYLQIKKDFTGWCILLIHEQIFNKVPDGPQPAPTETTANKRYWKHRR